MLGIILKLFFNIILSSFWFIYLPSTFASNESPLWFTQTDVSLDPRYKSILLGNGLRVVTIENTSPKQRVSIRMFIDAGSFQEEGNESGLAHFLEHMAFNGSTNIPEGGMIPKLEELGLKFGVGSNAVTNMTNTVYQLDLPSNDTESVNTALFLLREIASELDLKKDAIERERNVIKSEIRERDSVWFKRSLDYLDYVYKGGNLSKKIGLGTISGVENVTQSRLKKFYQTYYSPSNTTLVLAGNIQHEDIIKKVKRYFSDWKNIKSQPAVDPSFNIVFPHETEVKIFSDPLIETRIELSFIEREQHQPVSKASVFENWVHSIGRNALISRLENLFYESDARITYPSVSSELSFDSIRMSQVGLTLRNGDWEFGLTTLEQQLRTVAKFGFSDQEINNQIEELEKRLKNNVETGGDESSITLVDRLVNAVDSGSAMISPESELSLFFETKGKLTSHSVNEAFRKRWSSQPPRIYLSTPSSHQQGHEANLLEVYANSKMVQVNPYVDKKTTVPFAYQNFGKVGQAKLIGVSEYGYIHRYQFDNGVMLNVKSTDFEKNTVHISVRVGKGLMALTQKQFPLITLYNIGMSAGGLKEHDIQDLKLIFSNTSINLHSVVESNAFVSQSVVKKKDVFDQLKLFAALMIHGGYREQGKFFAIQMLSNYLNNYQGSPEQVEAYNIAYELHGRDLRWSQPTINELSAFSMSDLKPIIESAISSGPIEVGIVGDISQQEAIGYVAQTFGTLGVELVDTNSRYQIEFDKFKNREVTFHHKGEKTTALAAVYYSLPDARNTKQAIHFQILDNVIQQRLLSTIREELGASYSPYSEYWQSYDFKNFGYLALKTNTTVDQIDNIFEIYNKILVSLQHRKITDDELKRAKKVLSKKFELEKEINNYWLNLASKAQTYPDIIHTHEVTLKELSEATTENILTVARLINIDNILQVRVVPEK